MKKVDNPIPAEKRWEISADQSSEIPFAYEMAIRKINPEKLKEMEDEIQEIWKKMGKKIGLEAREMCSNPDNAIDVADSLNAFSNSIFGSEFGYEIRPGRGDSAFAVTMKCPLLKKSSEWLSETSTAQSVCMNYTLSAVEGINSGYTVNYEKQMCAGDRKCVMKIEKAIQ